MLAATINSARSLRLFPINRPYLRNASSLSAINRALNKGRPRESQDSNRYPIEQHSRTPSHQTNPGFLEARDARRSDLDTDRGYERYSGRDSKRDFGRDSTRDFGGDSKRDTGREPRRDSGRGFGRDSKRDFGGDSKRDSGRDSTRDFGRDSKRDSGRELRRDSGRDSKRDFGGDSTRDSGRELRRGSGRDSKRDSGREPKRDFGRDSTREFGRDSKRNLSRKTEGEGSDRPRFRAQRDPEEFGRRTPRRDTYSDHNLDDSRSNKGRRTNLGGAEDSKWDSKRQRSSRSDAEPTREPNRLRERSALYQDILDMSFRETTDFQPQRWDRLMLAINDAEVRYMNLLPSRPKELPSLKGNTNNDVRRELKLGIKDAMKEVEPKLKEQSKEWARLVQHLRNAHDVANANNIKMPTRPFFKNDDPVSSRKALAKPFAPGSIFRESQRPLSQDQLRKYVQDCVESELANLTNPPRTLPTKERVERLKAGATPTEESVSEGVAKTPEELDAKEEKRLKMARKREERRWIEEGRNGKEELKAEIAARDEETPEFEDTLGFSSGATLEATTSKFKPAGTEKVTNERPREESRSTRDRSRHETESRQKFTPTEHETSEEVYVSIPYTTAGSEFLYGLNVVYAALKAQRRRLHTLYIYNNANHAFDMSNTDRQLQKMAKEAKVKVRVVSSDFLPTLDKMANGRPHNGVILETSPLPFVPVKALGKIDVTSTNIPLQVGDQDQEQRAVNGVPTSIPYPTHTWRKPFVLLLDGILDPGNLGNILRTAYFYGVDAVAICVNTCAPVNLATVQKAASGAAEALTLIAIPFPAAFVLNCKKNGWEIFASVAPDAANARGSPQRTSLFTDTMTSPLSKGPGLLMLGAEGEGLRANLLDKATSNVSIRGFERRNQIDIGVESLNVSTATAVLLEAFCKEPRNLEDVIEKEEVQVSERIM